MVRQTFQILLCFLSVISMTNCIGNMTSVSCGSNFMRIILDRRFFNASNYSSITLRDPTCSATLSKAYIILESIQHLCGGEREVTGSKITYRNKVIMTPNQDSHNITRDYDVNIAFNCVFDANAFVGGVSFEPVRKISGNETGFGSFTFNISMYTSQKYARKYSYPAKVKLREWLYFQVTANVQDTSLILLIDRCYSTPTMDRNHHNKYFFIRDRCPKDKSVEFFKAINGQNKRFAVQSFRYMGSRTVVVHCFVFLCHNASTHPRCMGCSGNNLRQRREIDGTGRSSYSRSYLLEAGPIRLYKEEGREIKENQGKGGQRNVLLTVVIALAAGLVVFAVIVAFLVMKTRRPKSTANNLKEEIGIDNAPYGRQYVAENEVADGKEV